NREKCSALRSSTGNQGTADNSHVLLICNLATVFKPCSLATFQCLVVRGPGPITEMEYSSTSEWIPARSKGVFHSLTDICHTSFGSFLMMSDPSPCLFHPQSHTITLASGALR